MKKILLFLTIVILACSACTNKSQPKSDYIDIQEAADNMRYEKPDGSLEGKDIPQNLKIELANRFPVWRDSVGAAVDLSMRNMSKSHIPARIHAQLFVYSHDTKQPLYWTGIDVSHGRTSERGTMSVISIPVGASNDVIIPIKETMWAAVDVKSWPETPFHNLIPTGKYLMRFEMNIVDDKDQSVATAVSNFIEFETIATEKP